MKAIMCILGATALWCVSAQAADPPELARPQTPPRKSQYRADVPDTSREGIGAQQMYCGALLQEAFRTPYLDPDVWVVQADPSVTYESGNGRVRVYGVEAEVKNSNRFYSKHLGTDDAVLVCKMKATNFPPKEGRMRYWVHYCGQLPDRYAEVALDNFDDGKAQWRFMCLPVSRAAGGAPQYSATIPAVGDEHERFYEVMIERDGPSSTYRGLVNIGGEWTQIGKPYRSVGPILKVELKWFLTPGLPVDVEFADCRVYLNPKRHPLRFSVGGSEPAVGLRLEVWTGDGKTLVGRARTDDMGRCTIALGKAPWRAYPASAMFKLFKGAEQLGHATVTAEGVTGVYPNDHWHLSLPDEKFMPAKRP